MTAHFIRRLVPTLGRCAGRLARLTQSLKLRLALACLVLIAASAGVTTSVLLDRASRRTEQAVMAMERGNAERLAVVLQNRISTLQRAMHASVLNTQPATFAGHQPAAHFLGIKPVLSTLFATTFVASPDGQVLALRDERGVHASSLNIADRPYFRRTLTEMQSVVSDPIIGRQSLEPVIMMTVPVIGPDGRLEGVIGGSLRLNSRDLLAELSDESSASVDPVLTLVTDRRGRIIADRHVEHILENAAGRDGLTAAVATWQGQPDAAGATVLHVGSHIVARAGVTGLGWMVFRIADADKLFGGPLEARQQAWKLAALVALLGGSVMLILLQLLLRPLAQLEQRAAELQIGTQPDADGWPDPGGEIGQLSQVLRRVLQEREQAQQHNSGLLRKMQSLLATAPIGIAFSRHRRFELVSAEFAQLLGYTPQELVGLPTREIFASPDDYEQLVSHVPLAFAAQGQFDGELRFVRRDGSLFWGRLQGRPVDPDDALPGSIWLLADVTREREEREQLSWSASHDPLTSVHNRRAFEAALSDSLRPPRQLPLALLFIDLDRFKQVNDSAGHAAGDRILIGVAQAVLARVRSSDMVARIGGDEFAVLLQGCDFVTALAVAEQIRAEVEAVALDWKGTLLQVGASVGVADLDETVTDLASAMALADAACYEAKKEGRNSVCGRQPELLRLID
jgi:diguanylate cyclase (GGDEF)-like protein/PAS domain S-box-containing protein